MKTLFLLFCLGVFVVYAEEGASSDLLTEEQEAVISQKAETHQFQAEVNRLMDIIIRSLYKDRDIFIREIISNAADAIDKIRYQSLTAGAPVNEEEFQIRVKFDNNQKLLVSQILVLV
jgi:hypothetical protein